MIVKLSFVSSQFCSSSHEGGTVSVACSSGLIITAVNFASYGTSPTGTCGAYNTSSCHAPSSYSVVANACINQPSCSIDANSKVFGDPCEEALKGLYVQVTCDELKPSIVPIHLGSPTADPLSSPITATPTAITPSSSSTADDAVVDDNEGFTVGCCDGTLDGNRDDTVLGLSSSLTTDESASTPSDPSSSPITDTPTSTPSDPSSSPTTDTSTSTPSDPSSSPTTDTPTSTLSTSSTKMITNDDFIQAAEVGDLQRLKELIAEWKVTGDFDINATNKVSL